MSYKREAPLTAVVETPLQDGHLAGALSCLPGHKLTAPVSAHRAFKLDPLSMPAVPSLGAAHRLELRAVDGAGLSVYVLEFDRDRFAPAAFDAVGIGCPPPIARSVRKRQAEFLFGRLAAVLALSSGSWTGTSHPEIPIGPSGEARWPQGFIGSISHNYRFATAVAERRGDRGGVGIDIEEVIGMNARESLLGLVVDANEHSYLKKLVSPAWPLDVLLTIVFSAKESLFKGAFGAVGRYFGFDCARLVWLDLEGKRLRFALTETLCEQFVASQSCDVGLDFLDNNVVLTHFVWPAATDPYRKGSSVL